MSSASPRHQVQRVTVGLGRAGHGNGRLKRVDYVINILPGVY